MSPEQARGEGHAVDGRGDVYSLGGVLYQLLTGELPFRGTQRMLLHQVLNDEPRSPRTLNDRIPRDLETICLKAMAKAPARRYQSARDFADDLRRWLQGEPIRARPVGAWERGWRWAKRRPAVAALILVSVVAPLLLIAILAVSNVRIAAERDAKEKQRQEARQNLFDSLLRETRALRLARTNGYRVQAWDRLRQALQLRAGEEDRERLRQEAINCLGDFVGLEPTTWEDFKAEIRVIAPQPGTDHLAIGLDDGTIVLRHLATRAEVARLEKHSVAVSAIAFAGGGRRLVSSYLDGMIKVWEPTTAGTWTCRRNIETEPPAGSSLHLHIALTFDGQQLASLSSNVATVSLWNLADGTQTAQFHGRVEERFEGLALSPDGKLLTTCCVVNGTSSLLVWDVATQKIKQRVDLDVGQAVSPLVFSEDNCLLFVKWPHGFAIFDTSNFQCRFRMRTDQCFGHSLNPNGQLLAFAQPNSGVVRLWSVAEYGEREVAVLGDPASPRSVAFGADGKTLVAAASHSIRLWNLTGSGERLVLSGHNAGIPNVAFSPDGKLLASPSRDRSVKIWQTDTGKPIRTLGGLPWEAMAVAFSPDGRFLAAAGSGTTVQFWEVRSWQEVPPLDAGIRFIWSVSFSPDGNHFAAGGNDDGLKVWRLESDAAKGRTDLRLPLQPSFLLTKRNVANLSFSPDGNLLAWVERDDHRIRLRDMRTSQESDFPSVRPAGLYPNISFSREGNHLVFASANGEAEVWNVETRQKEFSFGGGRLDTSDPNRRTKTALSADGTRFAWQGGGVTVWDMASRKLLAALPEDESKVWSLAWSRNGERLAIGFADGGLVIWDLLLVQRQLAELGLGW
jgi:WD40 repeat protein